MDKRLLIQLICLTVINTVGWFMTFFCAGILYAAGILLIFSTFIGCFIVLSIRQHKKNRIALQFSAEQKLRKRIKTIKAWNVLIVVFLLGIVSMGVSEYIIKHNFRYSTIFFFLQFTWLLVQAMNNRKQLEKQLNDLANQTV